MGPDIPKAVVLVADVLPAYIVKVAAPFFIHKVTYTQRIALLVTLSFIGMICVALMSPISLRLLGVAIASLSSGAGEVTFLQLTHYYVHVGTALPGFGAGTGMAGLAGGAYYLLLTTLLRCPSHITLLISSFLPFLFIPAYFNLLPKSAEHPTYVAVASSADHVGMVQPQQTRVEWNLKHTLSRIQPLVVPFMVPLFLVYVAEYTINQGVTPTLLFPLSEMPFEKYRDAYPTYQTLYQLGVFISRSSSLLFRVHNLYLPSILQLINLLALILQALFVYLPNVYFIFIIIFYEGILGGLVYINAYHEATETLSASEREFGLGAMSQADSGGVVVAAFLSIGLELGLCSYQTAHGRPYCHRTVPS